MDKEVKVDVNLIKTCHGCLSIDRTVYPLGDNSDMLLCLLGSHKQCLVYGIEDIRICWECTTMLKKFKSFQNQVRTAQAGLMKVLYEIDSQISTLSKLTIVNKYYYDLDLKHYGHKKLKKNNQKLETITIIKTEFDDVHTYSDDNLFTYTDKEKADDIDSKNDDIVSKTYETDNKDDIDIEIDGFDNDKIIDNKDSLQKEFDCSFDIKDNLKSDIPIKVKKPRRRTNDTKCVNNVVGYYKRYAKLVKSEKKDWGSCEAVRAHFTMVQLGEKEMEDHFFTKDRRNTSYKRLPHKCEICTLGYIKEDDLKRHNDLNHHKESTPYKCTLCNRRQSSADALEKHWRSHSIVFRCKGCGEVCKVNFMRKHLDHAHTKTYECTVCQMKFGTLKLFTIHYKELHMTYVCDICNHSLTTKKKIEKHISEHHMTYACKDCDRTYKNYIYYKKHCYSMHPEKVNSQSVPELSFCVECNKQFPSIDKYKTHLRVSTRHNKKKLVALPCPDCGKVFGRKKNLSYHYNLFHLKKTKYYCELCDKVTVH